MITDWGVTGSRGNDMSSEQPPLLKQRLEYLIVHRWVKLEIRANTTSDKINVRVSVITVSV